MYLLFMRSLQFWVGLIFPKNASSILRFQKAGILLCPNVLQRVSHIMRSAVARLVGLLLGTVSSNVWQEKQHPKNHIGVTIRPTFSFLGCISTLSGIDAH